MHAPPWLDVPSVIKRERFRVPRRARERDFQVGTARLQRPGSGCSGAQPSRTPGRKPDSRRCALGLLGAAPVVPTPTPSRRCALTCPKPQLRGTPAWPCPPTPESAPHLKSQNSGHSRSPQRRCPHAAPSEAPSAQRGSTGCALPGHRSSSLAGSRAPGSASRSASPGPGEVGLAGRGPGVGGDSPACTSSRAPRKEPSLSGCPPLRSRESGLGRRGGPVGSRAWRPPGTPQLSLEPPWEGWRGTRALTWQQGSAVAGPGLGSPRWPLSAPVAAAAGRVLRPFRRAKASPSPGSRAPESRLRSFPRTFKPNRAANPSLDPPPWPTTVTATGRASSPLCCNSRAATPGPEGVLRGRLRASQRGSPSQALRAQVSGVGGAGGKRVHFSGRGDSQSRPHSAPEFNLSMSPFTSIIQFHIQNPSPPWHLVDAQ